MKCECEIIQDLLPIYAEHISSESTRRIVDEHLSTCSQCRNMLEDMQKDIKLPVDVDTKPLEDMGIGFRKQSLLSVSCAVLALLLVLHSLLILSTVPVWLSAEEAIVDTLGVQTVGTMMPPRQAFSLLTAPNVVRTLQSESGIWCEGYRINSMDAEPTKTSFFLNSYTGESLFYRGYFSNEKNTLLYGSADMELALMPQEPGADVDHTLRYLFYAALCGGLLCLVIGIVFRKRLGKGVAWTGLLLLCCALSAYFVTNGHFALWQDPFEPHALNGELLFRLVHMLIFGILLWGIAVCLWNRAAMYRKSRRREDNGTEL